MRIARGGKNLRPVSTGGSTPASLGGTGTLAAPTLGYPSSQTTNPPTIPVTNIPSDWAVGDVFKLALSSSSSMASASVLSHTITPTDITNGTFSVGITTLSGVTYFEGFGSHSGVDSQYLSNIVSWGDTTAPVITNTATSASPGQNVETTKLWDPITVTETGSGVPAAVSNGTTPGFYLAGGSDILLFEVAVVGGVAGIRWAGDGTQGFASPLDSNFDNKYDVTAGAIDYSGNAGTKALEYQVTLADTTPNAFSFTDVSGVPVSTLETSNTVTMSGLGTGINAPATVTGGSYSKNGGAFVAAGSFTVVNGDTIALQATSSSSGGTSVNVTLSVGGASGVVSDTYTITTTGASSALDTTINNPPFNYSNLNKTAANPTSTTGSIALAATSQSTGKRYWEVTVDAGVSAGTGAGLAGAAVVVTGFGGGSPQELADYERSGNLWWNGVNTVPGGYAAGTRLAFAFDCSTKTLWVGTVTSGVITWDNGNPTTPSGGRVLSTMSSPFKPMVLPNGTNDQLTVCLSAADQTATPPSGFTPWV